MARIVSSVPEDRFVTVGLSIPYSGCRPRPLPLIPGSRLTAFRLLLGAVEIKLCKFGDADYRSSFLGIQQHEFAQFRPLCVTELRSF